MEFKAKLCSFSLNLATFTRLVPILAKPSTLRHGSTWFGKLTNRSVQASSGNCSDSLPELVEGNTKMGTTQMNTAIVMDSFAVKRAKLRFELQYHYIKRTTKFLVGFGKIFTILC
jgi:hypothetical protein